MKLPYGIDYRRGWGHIKHGVRVLFRFIASMVDMLAEWELWESAVELFKVLFDK